MTDDPYILENGVLRNKLGITDYDRLKDAEADIGFVKLIDVDSIYKGSLDAEFMCEIHKHILGDIFDWAGTFRTISIYKEELVIPGISLEYANPIRIEKSLKDRITDLDRTEWSNMTTKQISTAFARKLALLWKVHPYRDGNTRTTLAFANLYAREHGFPMDMGVLLDNLTRQFNEKGKLIRYSIRDKFVLAALDEKDYPEPGYLASLFEIAIEKGKLNEVKKSEGR